MLHSTWSCFLSILQALVFTRLESFLASCSYQIATVYIRSNLFCHTECAKLGFRCVRALSHRRLQLDTILHSSCHLKCTKNGPIVLHSAADAMELQHACIASLPGLWFEWIGSKIITLGPVPHSTITCFHLQNGPTNCTSFTRSR